MTESEYGDLTRFRESDRFSPRERAALAWTEAIVLDASLADDALWAELHQHFTEPELVELGFFIALTLGQQRWIKTLALGHGQVLGDRLTGVARAARPTEASGAA
ncbi:MAG TPA: hypothetical protein VKZ60_06720 [Chloroflexota bacterium]|nr:hypothetical protein [Chloroflexota bacterium]